MERVCSRNEILDSLLINFIVPRKFAGVNDNGVASKDDQSYYVAILHPLFQGDSFFVFFSRDDV